MKRACPRHQSRRRAAKRQLIGYALCYPYSNAFHDLWRGQLSGSSAAGVSYRWCALRVTPFALTSTRWQPDMIRVGRRTLHEHEQEGWDADVVESPEDAREARAT